MNDEKKTQRESEGFYSLLVEHSSDAIYLFCAGKFEYVNPGFEKIFGYGQEEVCRSDFDLQKLFPSGNHPFADESPENISPAVSISTQYEFTAIKEDGRQIQVAASAAPVPYKSGTAIQGVIRDITRQKETEKRLLKNEARYLELADNIQEYILAVDMDGNVVYVNDYACQLAGYSKEKILKMNVADVVPEEYLPFLTERMARRRAGEKVLPQQEFALINKTGERYLFEISTTLITEENKPAGVLVFARDITEHKKMLESLKASEKKFRQFAELLPGSAFECDLNFQATFINKKALQTYGYTREDFAAGINVLKTVVPEEIDGLLKNIDELMTGTLTHPVELTALRKNGSRFPINLSAAPIMQDGKPVGVRGLALDITQYKEKEAALRQSEARYRSIIETIEDGYYEVDLSGRLLILNEAALKMLDRSREELLGKNYRVLFDDENIDKILRAFSSVYKSGMPAHGIEASVINKAGRRRVGELSVSLIRDSRGNPSGFRGILHDMTERNKMEEELRESREKFKNMVANVPGIIYEIVIRRDGSAHIPWISPGVNQLGVNTAEFIAAFLKDPYHFLAKDDKKNLWQSALYSMNSLSQWTWEGEVNISGNMRWLRFIAQPRRQDNGDTFFDCLILDMTEAKQAAEIQKDLEARLQQAQKMEAIGTLAGGIAHDFNNLLSGIQGYASLMQMGTDPSHPHYRKLKSIEELVFSGANLTKQLLGFASRGRYEVKPSNINDIIDKTASLFGRTKKEIFIHQNLADDIWIAEVDQGQMEQVLLNLYVNAGQAMPGGGNLYLETKNVNLTEDDFKQYSLAAGKYVKISITDTGVGMDETTQERIFEPFFTTKEMGRGTGLGLATVYGIVKGHNGIIDVYSRKGMGTAFHIYLPATDKKITAEHAPPVVLQRGNETVLLIDDETSVREVTQELLEALGYRVVSVGSGAAAIEIFRSDSKGFDIVILDMIMPGLSGSETFDALKTIDTDVKVILASGYSVEGQAGDIMKKGFVSFIQKPFRIAELSRKISEALGNSGKGAGNKNT
ncbi:MAG: hypothetical protein CVU52_04145 [Deltaproteobacteria bacterium HGW-Deltaproteobacteria-10]|nr:MAG: hypothetical protein CVU52_04145 [Deltaproteobacteria bacterium HGW-Deltaproteobacteria-10]